MSVICTICARGGSKGVPGKNIRPLLGRPLIAYTIDQALRCPEVDQVFVSTDSAQIADIARRAGAEVPYLRPAELATDTAPKIPVIQDLVKQIELGGIRVEKIIDLDPTSPLRDIGDIQASFALLDEHCDVVFSGYRSEKNPYFNMVEHNDDETVRLVKTPVANVVARQQAPEVFAMNGSVYVWHRRTLDKGLWQGRARLYLMPRERSIDIDTDLDFRIVELLMRDKLAS